MSDEHIVYAPLPSSQMMSFGYFRHHVGTVGVVPALCCGSSARRDRPMLGPCTILVCMVHLLDTGKADWDCDM